MMISRPRSTINRRTFTAGAIGAFAGISIVRTPARAAQYNFKVGYPLPQGHPQHIRMVEATARILAATNGRLQLQLFPNSELGSDDSSVSQLRSGAMEMYIGSDGVLSTVVMDAAIEGVGFAFKSQPQALAAIDGPLGDVVRKQMVAKGIYPFAKCWVNGFRQIVTSTKPIKTVDDLAGLKVRTPGAKLYVDMFKTLGASPTPVNVADVYTGLQTKVIDAVEVPMAIIEASKWYEPTKYLSITNPIWGNLFAVVNLDAWKSLPPDIQAVLNREIDRAGMLERDDMLHADVALRAKLGGQGLAVNDVSDLGPFRVKLKPFYADMKSAFSPEAWALLEKTTGRLT
jgi:tripartite ATP-independent transporter DctP family solute receptor